MAFVPSYQDYVNSQPQDSGGSEGGQGTFTGMSEDQWNSLSDDLKWNNVGQAMVLTSSDPRYADVAKTAGITSGEPIIAANAAQSHPVTDEWYADPSKVTNQDGVLFLQHDNLTPKAEFAGGGMSDRGWAFAPLLVVAGGLAAGSMLGDTAAAVPAGASEAGATGGFTSGADIAASGGASAGGAAGSAGGSIVGNAADQSYAGSFDAGGMPGATTPDLATASGTTPAAATPGTSGAPVTDVSTYAPGTQAPAPVTDVSTAAPSSGGGIIDTARGAYGNLSGLYNSLSPASRLILGQALGAGFRGAMAAAAQRQQLQAQVDAENRARQDVIRRGQVPALAPGTFTPKTPTGG